MRSSKALVIWVKTYSWVQTRFCVTGVDVEENSVIGANMEVKNALLSETQKPILAFLEIQSWVKIAGFGAGFNSANVRIDRETVKSIVKGEKIDTGLKSFGVTIGDNARIGIKSSTMPGVIIGENVTIRSGTMVMDNVDDGVSIIQNFKQL